MGSRRDDERETPSTVPAAGPGSGPQTKGTGPAPPAASLDATLPSSKSEDIAGDYSSFVTVSPEHYLLGKEIARGGMGRIFLARDRRLGRAVAVKEILVAAGESARRFEREARITARLQHPSIVNVHEGGVFPSGELFYSMALISGRSFDRAIADAKTPRRGSRCCPSCSPSPTRWRTRMGSAWGAHGERMGSASSTAT